MQVNILQGTGQSHTTKNYPVLNVNPAKVEKPCSRHSGNFICILDLLAASKTPSAQGIHQIN